MARILVVDDEPTILDLVRRRLESAGHEVHVTSEAIGTTRRIREVKPQLVIMDQQMPALSGTNLIKVIKELGKDGPKVLLYSSLPSEELSALAADSGADGFLCKTDGMEALAEKVGKLIGKGQG